MTTAAITPAPTLKPIADRALRAAAGLWLSTAVIGQAVFLFYIMRFYGPSTLTGNFQAWGLNKMLIKGFVPGDTAGNLAFGAHVLMAAVIVFGGTLQLVPQVRTTAPSVHRWNGRAFLVTAMGASLAGLYMTWVRHTADLAGSIAISLDALLILGFGALSWRKALQRDFAGHRRWAMRTFMVANAVWFMRLGFASFGMIAKALGGESLLDPFFVFWGFGSYLVPLAVLELYLRVNARSDPAGRLAMAGGLVGLTALMSLGIVGAWFGFFAPVLSRL
jgi:hypothetical protein